MFAAPGTRDPLLGVYALSAEWHDLIDPATEISVARLKLGWWREEIGRLIGGTPLHPITRFLAALPSAGGTAWEPLLTGVEAAASQLSGVPLEHARELESHAAALHGSPLLAAVWLAGEPANPARVRQCVASLATALYLQAALTGYRRDAHAGRIAFPVEELLTAGIDNDALLAATPPPTLSAYLDGQRARAATGFAAAADALAAADRPALRHLPVLAVLGERHVRVPPRARAEFRLGDLYNAWNTARRAAAGR